MILGWDYAMAVDNYQVTKYYLELEILLIYRRHSQHTHKQQFLLFSH